MTTANYEGLISNEILDIYGFIFSPDFDTSQQMYIAKFMKSIKEGDCKVSQIIYKYKKMEIPIILMGKNVSEEMKLYIEKYFFEELESIFSREESRSRNTDKLKDYNSYLNSGNLLKMKIGTENLLIREKDWFICKIFSDETILFIANPFIPIFKEDEVMKNLKYREYYYSKLKGYKKYINAYSSNIENRQNLFLNELKKTFSKFNEKINNGDGFVIGNMSLFLKNGYAVISGSKKDSDTCFKRNVFPFKTKNGIIDRLSEEEIDSKIRERKEYKLKCSKVEKRLNLMEKLLKERDLSWTIISKNDIRFDEESGNYKTWMNAQVCDNAHFGWFEESDFINWINMEGKIPFKRAQINYLSRKLEELSNKTYCLKEIYPKNPKKSSSFDDYDCLAKFIKDNKELVLDIDSIKEIIESDLGGLKKYTLEDFEKDLKRENRKNLLKNIFKF